MTTETINTTCPACGSAVIKKSKEHNFCTDTCRGRYWRVKKRYAEKLTGIILGYLAMLPKAEQEARYEAFEDAIHGIGRRPPAVQAITAATANMPSSER
jgi:hypothetical protein